MAAWKPLNISAYAWEGFSFIWSGQAETAEAIDQQLFYRGYSLYEFRDALQDLVERGWLTETAGNYTVTPAGNKIRETAERQTDAYFYAPWQTLQPSEVQTLHQLMTRLQERLQ
jgi:hypothetical protein